MVDAKDEHIAELREKIQQITEEKDSWRRRVYDHESSVKSMNEKLVGSQVELEKSICIIEDYSGKVIEAETRTEEIERELENTKSSLNQSFRQINLIEEQKALLLAEIEVLKQANDKLIIETSETKAEFENMKHYLEKHKHQVLIEGLGEMKQFDQLREEVESLKAERQKLKQEKIKWENNYIKENEEKMAVEKHISKMEMEARNLTKQVDTLNEQLKELQKENIQLHNDIILSKEQNKMYSDIQKQRDQTLSKLQEIEAENHSLHISLSQSRQRLDNMGQSREDLENRANYNLSRLEIKYNKLESECQLTIKERDKLQIELKKCQMEIDNLSNERNRFYERASILEHQNLELSRMSVEDKDRVNDTVVDFLEETKVETSAILKEMKRLTDQLNEQTVEKDNLMKEKQDLELAMRTLQKNKEEIELELKLAKSSQQELQSRIKEEESVRKTQQSTLNRSFEDIRGTLERMDEVESENRSLKNKLTSTTNELKTASDNFEKERQIYTERIEDLETRITEKSHNMEDLTSERTKLIHNNQLLEESLKENKIQMDHSRSEIKKLRKVNEQLQNIAQETEARIRRLIAEKEEIFMEMEAKAAELNTCLEKISTMAKEDIKKDEAITRIREENSHLKRMLSDASESRKSFDGRLAELKTENKKTEKDQKDLEALIRQLEQELMLKNAKIKNLETVLHDAGRDLGFSNLDISSDSPINLSLEVSATKRTVRDLTERNQFLKIQNEKLQEKLDNREALMQSLEKNAITEKTRLIQKHSAVINSMNEAAKNSKDLTEYQKKRFGFIVQVLTQQLRDLSEHIVTKSDSIDELIENYIDDDSLQMIRSDILDINKDLENTIDKINRAFEKIVNTVKQQYEIAQVINDIHNARIGFENQRRELKNQSIKLEEKLDINNKKMKHLRIIFEHLQKSVVQVVEELESLSTRIFNKNSRTEQVESEVQQFEQLLNSLEFRLQFLPKAEKIDKKLSERILQLEKLNSTLYSKFHRQKDHKLERYYQYIGEALVQEDNGIQADRELFKKYLKQLIRSLEERSIELNRDRDSIRDAITECENDIDKNHAVAEESRHELDLTDQSIAESQNVLSNLMASLDRIFERKRLCYIDWAQQIQNLNQQ